MQRVCSDAVKLEYSFRVFLRYMSYMKHVLFKTYKYAEAHVVLENICMLLYITHNEID